MASDTTEFDQDFKNAYQIYELLHEIGREPDRDAALDSKAMNTLMCFGHCFNPRNQREFLYLVSVVVKFCKLAPGEDTMTHCLKENLDTESDLS